MLDSISFAILGDYEIAKEFGKKGTTTDISIYDKKTSDRIYSWISPISFPDKIQSLLQVLNMVDYVILNVTKMDKYLGEQIVAIDMLKLNKGFILHSWEIDENKIKNLIKDSSLSEYKIMDNIESLKEEITKIKQENIDEKNGEVIIPIDHSFDVKGIGSVILGSVKKGIIKTYDQVKILPHDQTVTIKSIQIHDDPFIEARHPSRVGLALKGISYDLISRGDIICSNESSLKTINTPVNVRINKSRFYKGEIQDNQTYLISVGLQIKPCKFKFLGNNIIQLIPEKPVVIMKNQNFIVLKPDDQINRIIANGEFA